MAKWNDPSSMSFTFDMKPNEESRAFFERMMNEYKERDKQRSREREAAKYREGIDKRIEDCLRMNGKIP